MSGALQAVFQNQRSFGAAPGSQSYTTAGTYSWVAPAGVTKVSVVAVGGGGNGVAVSGAYCGGCGGAAASHRLSTTSLVVLKVLQLRLAWLAVVYVASGR